jgi:hypothetical protein
MWMQIIGKVCLALTPHTNHYWNIAFQTTARGIATPPMPVAGGLLTITFDFIDHQLVLQRSDGRTEVLALAPRTVADFYREVRQALERMDVPVRLWPVPVEIPDPIPFKQDTIHHAYDPAAAHACWEALVLMKPVFDEFRGRFIGKCSPVHFFWGGFDLAVTRFSGERAPERPGADAVTRESYSHAVISHGFWPGSGAVPEAAFYAYAAPEPEGFQSAAMRPSAAYYDAEMSIFVLPYEAVRTAVSPGTDLMAFLESTYEQAATLAGWSRAELERIAS